MTYISELKLSDILRENTLCTKQIYELLAQFAIKDKSHENIMFLKSVLALEKSDNREDDIKNIYDTYLATDSLMEINVDNELREQVKNGIVDNCYKYVLLQTKNDTFARFKSSNEFIIFLQKHNNICEEVKKSISETIENQNHTSIRRSSIYTLFQSKPRNSK